MSLALGLVVAIPLRGAQAQTTVDPDGQGDRYSYGANLGWLNWAGDEANGANFTEQFASGFVYGANFGWINLGDGSPLNGTAYANDSATDFGLNIDAAADPDFLLLSGYAWGANIGWINFTLDAGVVGAENLPRIDKATGIMKGFAYGANVGWIALESVGVAEVNTGLGSNAAGGWQLYE